MFMSETCILVSVIECDRADDKIKRVINHGAGYSLGD